MEHALVGLAGVLVVGIGAQWLAWRLRIPSIFLLLLAGFVAGPVTGWINPDELFGDTLFAGVSVAVAIILFEGGLSLDVSELRKIGGAFWGLLVVGTAATFGSVTVAARFLLGFGWDVAALLGGILVVTGPTVIIPLLRQVKPTRQVASLARWEGIVTDPVGAILAVLIFDFIVVGETGAGWEPLVGGAGKALIAGGGLGLAGAAVMVVLLKKFWVPDFLRPHVTLAVVLAVFVAANEVLSESGLLAVTVMGSAMASQSFVQVRRIVQFKEHLRVLLISGLFVVLAARLPLNSPVYTNPGSLAFLGFLLVVQRPLAVGLATIGSGLSSRERAFLAMLAPRGIVAAAVGSVFAIELMEMGHAGGEQLAEVVFLVIMGTVAFYGLLAGPMARRLGLAVRNPQGFMFVGASPWVRGVAQALQERGVKVLLIDSNFRNVTEARNKGLTAHYANILDDGVADELELDGIGRCILATPNDGVNALAADHLRETFDQSHIFQVAPEGKSRPGSRSEVPMHGRVLSDQAYTGRVLAETHSTGFTVKQTKITNEFTFEDLETVYGGRAMPLFVEAEGVVQVLEAGAKRKAKPGSVVISLAPESRDS